jgi:hypothetical protein
MDNASSAISTKSSAEEAPYGRRYTQQSLYRTDAEITAVLVNGARLSCLTGQATEHLRTGDAFRHEHADSESGLRRIASRHSRRVTAIAQWLQLRARLCICPRMERPIAQPSSGPGGDCAFVRAWNGQSHKRGACRQRLCILRRRFEASGGDAGQPARASKRSQRSRSDKRSTQCSR